MKGNRNLQIRELVFLPAHQRKAVHDILFTTMEWLEKYIEIAGYYPDWENRKQIADNGVVRTDIIDNSKEAEKWFSITLFGLRQALQNKPESLHEELKKEFYQWLDAAKIDASNCHPQLKNILCGFNEVLEGRGEKIMKEALNKEETGYINSPDYAEKLTSFFSNIQNPLEEAREQEQLLKGKRGDEIVIESKFIAGDRDQGERTFNRIARTVFNYNDFHFFPQKRKLITFDQNKRILSEKVKQNLNEWSVKEIVTRKRHSNETKESALVHKEAILKDFGRDGYLKCDLRMIYFENEHDEKEWGEIKNYYVNHLTQLRNSQPPTNSEIVQDVKTNPQNWTLDEIGTEVNGFGGTIKQEWVVIRWDARVDDFDQRTGKLNFNGNPIYHWENFNSRQRFEIKKVKNILGDYSTEDEIKWIVEEVKDNPNIWRIEEIQGQTYLIHGSAQIEDNEIGTLIYNKQKFSNSQWAEILVNDIKQHANEWKVKEIPTSLYGRDFFNTKKFKKFIINQCFKEKYGKLGGLMTDDKNVHSWDFFSKEQQIEIDKVLNSVRDSESMEGIEITAAQLVPLQKKI